MTGWCVEHAREEGIYKSRKVMGIPRKVVQCLFFNREICLCCFCERTQTNLLRFLVSLSFRRLSRTNNVFSTICDRNVALRTKPSRTKLFLKELYIYFLKLTKDRLHYFHVLSILRLFIKSLGEEHLKSPFYWCRYWCTVCVWSHLTGYQ